MKINLKVVKTMKLFSSLLLFLLFCFGVWIFWEVSVEIAKIYSLMKYLKHPIASQIAANFSFAIILILIAFFLGIILNKLKFTNKTWNFVQFIPIGIIMFGINLLFLGPPNKINIDDFLIKHKKLFIQLNLEDITLKIKMKMVVNCFKDGIVELIEHPFSYTKLIIRTIFIIFLLILFSILATYYLKSRNK
jgi:hypothetical protein